MSGTAEQPPIFRDIEAAMRRNDGPAAYALAREALASGLRHPALHVLRGQWHESEGRPLDAVQDFDAALQLNPGEARALLGLGRSLNQAGRYRMALRALARRIALPPPDAAAFYQLGFAHEQLGELAAAAEAYQNALSLDARMDDAIARLAALAARRGDHEEAHRLADRALALNARSITAVFAHIVSDLAERRFAEAAARAEAITKRTDAAEPVRANAQSFLGDARDGERRYADAFRAYQSANESLLALNRATFEGRETGRAVAQRLMREFQALPASAWRSASPGHPARHAFIIGFPRSGTTLLGQILAAHPDCATLEEKPLLKRVLSEFVDAAGGLARFAALPEDALEPHRAAYWTAVRENGVDPAARFVVDQTPLNTIHLPVIARLFPAARIVFALRDPRDVVLSCFRRLFAITPYLYEFLSLEGAAWFYDETMRLFGLYRERLGREIIEVRNETLAADFGREARRLCDALGLGWDDALLRFAEKSRGAGIATPSAMQLAGGINADGVGHWKAYARELAPVMPVLAPWVERYGYGQNS